MIDFDSLKVPQHFLDTVIKPACMNDARIMAAFHAVPREFFMDEAMRRRAYIDSAQPIGYGQTISQPSLVAAMLYHLEPQPGDRCLEIGAGSGFVTGLLSKLVDEVTAIELLPELSKRVQEKMRAIRAINVKIFTADGSLGFERNAPYQRIIVSAGATRVSEKLTSQLAEGGVMIIPLNGVLTRITKGENGALEHKSITRVAFVDFINS